MLAVIKKTSQAELQLVELEIMLNDTKYNIGCFNDRLSVIAFIFFGQTFAAILAYAVDFLKLQFQTIVGFQIVSFIWLSFDLLMVFLVVHAADIIYLRLKAEYRIQLGAILKRGGYSSRAAYVISREKGYKIKFKAYGMFYLNKRCFLNFMSALVTFTILFMQLNRVL
ncbi:hypothetical protein HDE_10992 [Halotydeus destructor]|nr:hypothetical protein HDE_10992 [Halotydeus destructor]